jgi:hypothetical protein
MERPPRFCAVAAVPGCEDTLLAPDVTSHDGEGVAEGRVFLAVPIRISAQQACGPNRR